MTPWKFVLDDFYPSRRTMDRDLELFNEVVSGQYQGIFRIYNWQEPAITTGYHQKSFTPYDTQLDIPIIRRPTGGGAVLHMNDFTYSIAASIAEIFSVNILKTYTSISHVFARALQRCGLEVKMEGKAARFSEVCFARTSPVELVIGKNKIMGAAQLRRGDFILQQGVLPLTIDEKLMGRVFGPGLNVCPVGIYDIMPAFQIDLFISELRDAFFSELGISLSDKP